MDVTDRKTREEEYRSLQAQLLQAQKMESIGTLAVGLVHNMNNILAIVMGYASRLERFGDDPGRVQQSVHAITQAAQRGAALLQQLTGVAAKSDLLFAPVSVNDVLQELLPMIMEIFPRTIVFNQNLRTDLPLISADANQIQQALLNILVNARDAMPDGGTISLTTEVLTGSSLRGRFPNPQDTPYVRVRIVDTGEGMTPETHSRIFEPFFTTRDKTTYPGLGLSTVYGIVASHKGFIDVTSALERGTTVDLYFPAGAHLPRISAAPSGPRTMEVPKGDETILVVEDEEMLRGLVREVLSRGGYTVLEASDGEDGIAQYLKNRSSIDLVLLDLGLPKKSGDSVFTELKKVNPNVRVVFSTGYVKKEKSSELMELGALGVVHKPYAVEELMSVVRASLDRRRD
jgi:nitrogen-specific signal transduction histidine kinase/ActR/RegA family two-component response regulator